MQIEPLPKKKRIARISYIWLLGFAVFLPSILMWVFSFGIAIYKNQFDWSMNWHNARFLYLPFFAAVVGFSIPTYCFLRLQHASVKKHSLLFTTYLAVLLIWGAIDIKNENYQIGGHDYPNGPMTDGHKFYWHTYFTWYFFPYRAIEEYKFN